jgi:hypothetical protein
MRQVTAELIESCLEVDVVFPKRVVRVENQKLPLHPERYNSTFGCPFKGATRFASAIRSRCTI